MIQKEATKTDTATFRQDMIGKKVYIPRIDKIGVVVKQRQTGEIEEVKVEGEIINVINDIVEKLPQIWNILLTLLKLLKII